MVSDFQRSRQLRRHRRSSVLHKREMMTSIRVSFYHWFFQCPMKILRLLMIQMIRLISLHPRLIYLHP